MSTPDPNNWKATNEELETAWDDDFNPHHEGFNSSGHVAALTESVARRRALEELKALAEQAWMHPHGYMVLDEQVIRNRIAAIEAEGE